MANPVILLAVGVLAGAGLGALVTATVVDHTAVSKAHMGDDAAHDHTAHDHGDGHSGHKHKVIEAESPVPTLELVIHPDGPQSRNLELVTTNFTFDPKRVNGDHVPGFGHAHIYVNDVKQPRAYSHWTQLSALPKGTHEIRVTLNANDHSYLAVNGTKIEATTTLTIE